MCFIGPLFPGDELRSLVSQLVTLAGSVETEHKCEIDCHSLVQHNTLLQHGCPLVCRRYILHMCGNVI